MIDARTLGEKPSGVGIYAYRFARALSDDAATRIVLVTDVCRSRELRELAQRENVSVLVLGTKIRKGPALWRYFHFLRRAIAQERPELFWEVNNLLPVRLRNPYGKYVVTIHDIFPLTMPEQHSPVFRSYFRYGLGKTVKSCDAVIFLTRSMQREIVARFPRLEKLPQHVGYAIAEPAAGERAEREDFFLYVGNLEKRKGADLLIEAYRRYRAQGGKSELLLAGKLRDAEIESSLRAAERELSGLRYLGYVSEEERDALYRRCRCMVFPSRGEGFGIPLIEAMASGADVIASRIGVFEEIAGDRVRYFDLERGAEGLCAAMLAPAAPPRGEWDNPFTADKLVPGLRAFLRELIEK